VLERGVDRGVMGGDLAVQAVIARLDKTLRAALPQPTEATATTNNPNEAHGSSSSVPARSRHAAPSSASTAWEQDAATVTCAGPSSHVGRQPRSPVDRVRARTAPPRSKLRATDPPTS
jgi:hypothetical protein